MSRLDRSETVARFVEALLSLDQIRLEEFEERLKAAGPLENLEALVVPALEEIGRRWEAGTASLSQVYLSGRACEQLSQNFPSQAGSPVRSAPPIAIATLEDFHVLGKRLVLSALRASGYEVADWGRMGVAEVVEAVETERIRILLVSVLMLPSALRIRPLCDRLKSLPSPPVVVAGGAPFRFDPALAREVGADYFGRTASEAIDIVTRIVAEQA